jgi:hypothetical protein
MAGLSLPLGAVLPAFIFAFGARAIKLHDLISDICGIRQRFDVHNILMPVARAIGAQVTTSQLKNNRRQLMAEVFYKYISKDTGTSVIDRHYTTMAFDQWSWYWILLEMSIVSAITAGVLLFAGAPFTAAILLILILLTLWALRVIRALCSKYASQQVHEILSDDNRKREVEGIFRALPD